MYRRTPIDVCIMRSGLIKKWALIKNMSTQVLRAIGPHNVLDWSFVHTHKDPSSPHCTRRNTRTYPNGPRAHTHARNQYSTKLTRNVRFVQSPSSSPRNVCQPVHLRVLCLQCNTFLFFSHFFNELIHHHILCQFGFSTNEIEMSRYNVSLSNQLLQRCKIFSSAWQREGRLWIRRAKIKRLLSLALFLRAHTFKI